MCHQAMRDTIAGAGIMHDIYVNSIVYNVYQLTSILFLYMMLHDITIV